MAKYTFTKPFETKISVGGIVGTSLYTKKTGDVVEGEVVNGVVFNDGSNDTQQLKVDILGGFPLLQGAQQYVMIPMSFFAAVPKINKSKSASFFTAQNIVIGMVCIVLVLGILKVTKVI